MNPQDMDFQVIQMQSKTFDTMLEMIASFSPDQARKRNETNCKRTKYRQIVGFIKLGSPLINSKPRNDYLGGVPDLPVFNKQCYHGFQYCACSTIRL